MVLGMSLSTFTTVHVIISLIGIVSGFVVVYGMLNGSRLGGWNTLFLVTTILTSVTGFLFPLSGLTPAVIFGIISLIVLAIALAALYAFDLGGAWRWIYIVTALLALYLNSFVGVRCPADPACADAMARLPRREGVPPNVCVKPANP